MVWLITLAPDCNGSEAYVLLVVFILSDATISSVDGSVGTELGLLVLVVVLIVGVVTEIGTVVGMVKNGPIVIA